MNNRLASRILKLEVPLMAARRYVVRVNSPRTDNDRHELRLTHRPVAVLPHKCRSSEEWALLYAPKGTLQ